MITLTLLFFSPLNPLVWPFLIVPVMGLAVPACLTVCSAPIALLLGTIAPCLGALLGGGLGCVAGILPPWFPMGILPFPGFFTSICVTTGAGGFVGGLSGLACWGAEICAPVSCLGLPLGGCGGLFEGLGTAAGGLFQGCGDAINGCCHTLVL